MVDLPVLPIVAPMLAKPQSSVPAEPGVWSYEPKWDGFRALVFRDRDEVVIQSRNGKELGRYFPELVAALREELSTRCVLDGEVVVPREIDGRVRLDWDSLSQRIHPAESRIRMLAEQTPAHFIGFDALATGDRSVMAEPFRVRRAVLIDSIEERDWCHVTRTAEDPELGAHWLTTFEGAGLDGVIAKHVQGQYLPGKREMVKVKHHRDADCVAIGYRIHKSGEGVGSVLLGLYGDDGELQMVGGAASFTAKDRIRLLTELEPLRKSEDLILDAEPSRWNSAADKRWIPIRPEKVAEVAYDQMEGNNGWQRFRHTVRFMRWRPDRDPASCTFSQLDTPLHYDLNDVLDKN